MEFRETLESSCICGPRESTCLVSRCPGLKVAVIHAASVHYHLGYLAAQLRLRSATTVTCRSCAKRTMSSVKFMPRIRSIRPTGACVTKICVT